MDASDAGLREPPGGGRPPAPPSAGDPPNSPDPRDPGAAIEVAIGGVTLGDLGNHRVDARLLNAIVLRDKTVAAWLGERGVTSRDIEADFPEAAWPMSE